MATYQALQCISVPASADLSARQFRFMTINASGQLAASTAGAKSDGVLQDKPNAAGVAGALAIDGVSMVQVGAAVTAGDDIAVGTNGVGLTATTGDIVVGRALESGSGNGSIIPVLIVRAPEPLA